MADVKMHLAHILVSKKYEAQDLQRKLFDGKSFGRACREIFVLPFSERQKVTLAQLRYRGLIKILRMQPKY